MVCLIVGLTDLSVLLGVGDARPAVDQSKNRHENIDMDVFIHGPLDSPFTPARQAGTEAREGFVERNVLTRSTRAHVLLR
jgi:hypothetical protein